VLDDESGGVMYVKTCGNTGSHRNVPPTNRVLLDASNLCQDIEPGLALDRSRKHHLEVPTHLRLLPEYRIVDPNCLAMSPLQITLSGTGGQVTSVPEGAFRPQEMSPQPTLLGQMAPLLLGSQGPFSPVVAYLVFDQHELPGKKSRYVRQCCFMTCDTLAQ
jgi:hypothetical protein